MDHMSSCFHSCCPAFPTTSSHRDLPFAPFFSVIIYTRQSVSKMEKCANVLIHGATTMSKVGRKKKCRKNESRKNSYSYPATRLMLHPLAAHKSSCQTLKRPPMFVLIINFLYVLLSDFPPLPISFTLHRLHPLRTVSVFLADSRTIYSFFSAGFFFFS